MKVTKSSSSIKALIIAGYLLVVAIMIIGLITIYNNLVEFSEQKIRDEDRSELIVIGSTISKLYEIENSQNLYSADMASRYFSVYDSVLPSIERNLDSLKILSSDSLRVNVLDSIKILLNEKNDNLKEIAALLDSIQKAPTIERHTVSSFVPPALKDDVHNFLKGKNINQVASTNDTTIVKGERKGFFSRLRDAVAGKVDSTVLVEKQPILKETEFRSVIDTVINKVMYSERLNFERRQKFQRVLFERQTRMTNMNNMLTERIDYLLTAIEKEESNKYIQLLENKNAMLVSSQRTIFFASMLAALIAMGFGVVSLLNINRNFRYRKQLEESNMRISNLLESRQKLMLTISHDIKAPMGSILGYAELMESDVKPQKKELYLENMRKSGEHILQLVGNLLNYHKLESDTWSFKEINFNVHDLVEVTALSFEPAALRKKLEFSIENGIPKNFLGFGDAYVIRQVMSNILSNAIKYTPSGSVWLKAWLTEKNGEHRVHFSVKDTGPGIDEEERKVIFQEFRQLKSENPDLFEEGSGLGLAITHGLVQKLNGELTLESEKGHGAEFSVSLPIKQASSFSSNPEKIEARHNYDFTGFDILLVDDDPIQLTMASEMLKLKNARAVTETNPKNVLKIIGEKRFDIIFVDVQMPDISGFDLADMIRKSGVGYCQNVPIIILSAKTKTDQISGNESYTDFLAKPFTSNSLFEIIHKYAGGPRQKSKSTQTPQAGNAKDIEKLIDFVKDDKQISIEIIDSFLTETSANISKLQKAFGDDDAQTASALAHKMLPVFQMMGAGNIVEIFMKLEKRQNVSKIDANKVVSLVLNYLSEAKQLKDELSSTR